TDRFARVGPQWLEAEATVARGDKIGRNAAPWIAARDGCLRYDVQRVTISRTGRRHELACTQEHHTLEMPEPLRPAGGEVREAVRTSSFASLSTDPVTATTPEPELARQLWPADHAPGPHQWGMVIDLDRCTGCAACVISCQAENNVPVVGKDEVRRHR